MTEQTKELAPEQIGKPQSFMAPRNFADMMTLANTLAKSDIVPAAFKGRPENILIAVGMGQEVGLNPFQALQSIFVVNGRPSLWGDAVLGIVQASGLLEYCEETMDEKQSVATCKVKRRGDPVEVSRSFSLADARKAGLSSKPGPWQQYPSRMLQMRARSWALRDKFSDLLRGLQVREEMEDVVEAEVADDLPLRKSEIQSAANAIIEKVDQSLAKDGLISTEERKAVAELAAANKWPVEKLKELLSRRYGIASSADLPKDKLEDLKDVLANGEPPEAA